MSVLIYKDNIVERVGGQSEFDFVIMNYCESICNDSSLKSFFAQLDLNGLIELQTEFLNAAFIDTSAQETEATIGSLALKHQLLWQMGLDETHFEKLRDHFAMALRDAWTEEAVVQLAEKHFNCLRPLFQQSSSIVKTSSPGQRPPRAIRSFNRGVNGLQRI